LLHRLTLANDIEGLDETFESTFQAEIAGTVTRFYENRPTAYELDPQRVVVHATIPGSVVVIFSFTNPAGPNAFELPTNADITLALNDAKISGDWGTLSEQYGQIYGYRQTTSTDPEVVAQEVAAERPVVTPPVVLQPEEESNLVVVVLFILLVVGVFGAVAVWKLRQTRQMNDMAQKGDFDPVGGGGAISPACLFPSYLRRID
jgi:hypothetical protein